MKQMSQNNIDTEEEIKKLISSELSKIMDSTIIMDLVSPETKGMELSKRQASYKKKINRKDKLDNLLNEKSQN
jgi:hypothetical protein